MTTLGESGVSWAIFQSLGSGNEINDVQHQDLGNLNTEYEYLPLSFLIISSFFWNALKNICKMAHFTPIVR